MKQILTALLVLSTMGCTAKKQIDASDAEIVTVDFNSTKTFMNSDIFSTIEIIPINDTINRINIDAEIIIYSKDFYIVNKNSDQSIARLDSAGNFINNIGHRGRGNKEYISVKDIAISDDTVSVFSSDVQMEYLYSTDGKFIGSKETQHPFNRIRKINDFYWYYLGYDNMHSNSRLICTDKNGIIKKEFLDEKINILGTVENANTLTLYNDTMYVREYFNKNIYAINSNNTKIKYVFDFRKYAIPNDFYKQADVMSASDILQSCDFAAINRFLENDSWIIAECIIQYQYQNIDDIKLDIIYMVKNKKTNEWHTLKYRMTSVSKESAFVYSLKYLTDNSEILFLIDTYDLINDKTFDSNLVANPEVLDSITENDNPVILKCKLKN
ncbi:MAG: 6-bladed beta-propeller [Prevotellaceae bacterium]|jgi:hypothetical protein|nr:6-bladed beta-propeller [Prevotellaceae bacterium]